jgi:hypothetical protein
MLERSSLSHSTPPSSFPKSVYRTIVLQFLFETLCNKILFWRIESIFMQCTCVWSFLYSTILTINVSTQLKQCIVRKKKCRTHETLIVKNSYCPLQNYLAAVNQQDWIKALSEIVVNVAAHIGSVHCSGGAASYILVSLFIDVWSLGCTLHGTPYISSSIFA